MPTPKTTRGESPLYEIEGNEQDERRPIRRTDAAGNAVLAHYLAKSKTIEFVNEAATRYRIPVIKCVGEAGLKYAHFAIGGDVDGPPNTKEGVEAPRRPKMDKRLGDKTPEVVEYYQQFRPKEFKIRYGVMGYATQRVTMTDQAGNAQRDDKGQVKTELHRHVLIAQRKTHLTVIPNGTEVWEDGRGPAMAGEEDDAQ